MANNKMLIDATHPEETRVVVVRGNRVEEFDFESAQRKQLRGNIYLAKVTRVEPSLQAAFVEYGGNRHGFLAFSEIHPDYYQIPVADRQALLEEDARAHRDDEDEAETSRSRGRRSRHRGARRRGDKVRSAPIEITSSQDEAGEIAPADEPVTQGASVATEAAPRDIEANGDDAPFEAEAATDAAPADTNSDAQAAEPSAIAEPQSDHAPDEAEDAVVQEPAQTLLPDPAATWSAPAQTADDDEAYEADDDANDNVIAADETGPHDEAAAAHEPALAEDHHGEDEREDEDEEETEDEHIESVGGADALEEVPERSHRPRRNYKIQEVIKRRQVMLVQVVKEERGNKGAALTTYLSLAGRYSVLMPNTARGGGISRKITNAQDRYRLKDVVAELDVPEGMGIILRTAGASRTKTEIKRDFEYLLRMWENVRDLTLRSQAPMLVYEEGSLIKRSIRDLYNKDIDEVTVAGEAAFGEARDFMRMLMPSHARNVKMYRDAQPLFSRYGVENQLDGMFQPTVQLRSGGYIVLNQTEALVAIDVNSGRATREHHIEDTALKTNLEAAEEVARQLRLRDLAGLIVIDFIDMDEKRNNRAVERKLAECLKQDRARIQVGRISHFGLLEMSRQRIRASVLESSTEPCPHCGGSGHVRSVASMALQLLRSLEETLLKGATHNLVVRTRTEVALYVLNHKRAHLRMLEERFKVLLAVNADATMAGHHSFIIDRGEQVHTLEAAKALIAAQAQALPIADLPEDDFTDPEIDEAESEASAQESEAARGEKDDGDRGRRRRRRGRRGGRAEKDGAADDQAEAAPAESGESEGEDGEPFSLDEVENANLATDDGGETQDGERRRRRRGRRGGRRRRGTDERAREGEGEIEADSEAADADDAPAPIDDLDQSAALDAPAAPPAPIAASEPTGSDLSVAAGANDVTMARAESEAPTGEDDAAPRRRSTIREKVSFFIADAVAGSDAPPAPTREAKAQDEPAEAADTADARTGASDADKDATDAPRRSGWWSRR